MSENLPIKILSGPFGSLLNDRFETTTERAFANGEFDKIRNVLEAYRDNGVTQPVTPTFGAAARGVHGGEFTPNLKHWNTIGASLTREVFPHADPLGSIAPILDTSGKDDSVWELMPDKIVRASRIHIPQLEALHDGGIRSILCEAFHDINEAIGVINAAEKTGMKLAIVSFEPRGENPLPDAFEHRPLGSYNDVLNRLRDRAHGRIDVQIGLNCGNVDSMIPILADEPERTFSAIYPNQCAVPSGAVGKRFHDLAQKNHQRNENEKREFALLRERFEIRETQLDAIITLCRKKCVGAVGLCCGASPEHTAVIRRKVS